VSSTWLLPLSSYRWQRLKFYKRIDTHFATTIKITNDCIYKSPFNTLKGNTMNLNWDRVADQWQHYSGKVKRKWDKLTDDQIFEINGNREILATKLQENYGITRSDANLQIDKWVDRLF
jgi:uncharacterized protein YjbJ (UPF0337 family)